MLWTIPFARSAAGQDAQPAPDATQRSQDPSTSVEPAAPAHNALMQEASTRFRRGVLLFQEGAFRAALVEFERANELVPDYRLLYNIGQTHWQLHDYLSAARSYERYLEAGAAQIPASRRAEVESALRELRARVARLTIHVDQVGAEVFVDDQLVGVTPLAAMISVNVGRHRIYARMRMGAQVERMVDLPGGEQAHVSLAFGPLATASEPTAEPALPALRRRRAAIATTLVAGTLLASAAATGIRALTNIDQAERELALRPPLGEADAARVRALQRSADGLARATDVLIGAGLAAAVTSLVLWLSGRERTPAATPRAFSWLLSGGGVPAAATF